MGHLDAIPDADLFAMLRDQVKVTVTDSVWRSQYLQAIDGAESGANPNEVILHLGLKDYPVDMEEFLFSHAYLNRPRSELYPVVVDELYRINNPNNSRIVNPYTEAVFTGSIGCVPGDTECLTPSGWVRMDAYAGQTIAQWDNGLLSWVTPTLHAYKAEYFYHLKTPALDQMLSPEHRILYRDEGSLSFRTITAGDLANLTGKARDDFAGRIPTTFTVPGPELPAALLRVQAMVASKGILTNPTTGDCIVPVGDPGLISRARAILDEASIPYLEEDAPHHHVRFRFQAPFPSTKLHTFGWALGSKSLRILLEESLQWSPDSTTLLLTSKEEADFFSFVGAATGYRTHLREKHMHPVDAWVVQFHPDSEPPLLANGSIHIVPAQPNEKMYCFSVPSSYFVARHAGKPFITGNSAKTTTALYTTAYQLYVLSCFRHPHTTFGMDSTSEILFIFQSMSGGLAQSVDYTRFREICEQSDYFRTRFPFDKDLKRSLVFPKRIEVKAIGSDSGAIGQNVIGGMIDEMNFMAVVERSKRSIDKGTYNQALTIYNGIARRRKSRFMQQGSMPGILCLVSSKRYPGEFTDKKMEEAKNDPTIYVYDKRVWDVKPEGTFTKGWFDVFVGDLTRKARILEPEEEIPMDDQELVVAIPEEFRSDFENDMIGAIRDIAGVSTLARYPFFQNVGKVGKAFGKRPNVFSLEETDFVSQKLQLFLHNIEDKEHPRWVHIDLGVTNDSCGMAIGYVPGFKTTVRVIEGRVEKESMPRIRFDGLLRINPPKGDEILFYKVREILYLLSDHGVYIKWVTFDSFQSVDSIQLLRQKGYSAGRQSMDIINMPYDMTKAAFYDERIEAPLHSHCVKELLSLEKDAKTGRIDHPSTSESSKDIADAVAGVVYGLTMRREIWNQFGIPIQTFQSRLRLSKEPQHVSSFEKQEG